MKGKIILFEPKIFKTPQSNIQTITKLSYSKIHWTKFYGPSFDVICGNLICLILRITTISAILFLLSLARGDSSLSDCYITQILSADPVPMGVYFDLFLKILSFLSRILLVVFKILRAHYKLDKKNSLELSKNTKSQEKSWKYFKIP